MSDEAELQNNDNYVIENNDAGASNTIPMEAGQIKKGGFMVVKGRPCKVLNISVSKTGKHGHAKCNFLVQDIFNGRKYEDMVPSTHGALVPIVTRTEWEIMNIDEEGFVSLFNEGGEQKDDLKLPEFPEEMAKEIIAAWNDGENQISVSVQISMDTEQIIAFKKAD